MTHLAYKWQSLRKNITSKSNRWRLLQSTGNRSLLSISFAKACTWSSEASPVSANIVNTSNIDGDENKPAFPCAITFIWANKRAISSAAWGNGGSWDNCRARDEDNTDPTFFQWPVHLNHEIPYSFNELLGRLLPSAAEKESHAYEIVVADKSGGGDVLKRRQSFPR